MKIEAPIDGPTLKSMASGVNLDAIADRLAVMHAGTIVQVGSALAYRSIPLQSAYCAAKHGLVGLTRAWSMKALMPFTYCR